MGNPAVLLQNLNDAIETRIPQAIDQASHDIEQLDPTNKKAGHAIYRLALFQLTIQNQIERALVNLKRLADVGSSDPELLQARVTFAIALAASGQKRLSLFQLRKVLSLSKDLVSQAMALDYLSLFLKQDRASARQIKPIEQERVSILEQLRHNTRGAERQVLALRLAAALEDRGLEGDFDKARELLQTALAHTQELPKGQAPVAREALKRLKNR